MIQNIVERNILIAILGVDCDRVMFADVTDQIAIRVSLAEIRYGWAIITFIRDSISIAVRTDLCRIENRGTNVTDISDAVMIAVCLIDIGDFRADINFIADTIPISIGSIGG